jgi:perosamine synthetase
MSQATIMELSQPDHGWLERTMQEQAANSSPGSRYLEAFEAEFALAAGRVYAIAVRNSQTGLRLALRACQLHVRDEVILSPSAWPTYNTPLSYIGAHPVFADIQMDSGCLDPQSVESHIGPQTRAIIASNSNGHPADWHALEALADKHSLMLVEDSSEAIGSHYLGRSVGGFGNLSVFDFSRHCALNCGAGAMVVTDDPHLAEQLYRQRTTRTRLAETHAAIGLVQLERLDEMLAERKRVEKGYRQGLAGIAGLHLPRLASDVDEVHWALYQIRLAAGVRPALMSMLEQAGIACEPLRKNTLPARSRLCAGLPVWHTSQDKLLGLPFHSRLCNAEVQRITQCIRSCMASIGDSELAA